MRDRKAWAILVLIAIVMLIPLGYYIKFSMIANGDVDCAYTFGQPNFNSGQGTAGPGDSCMPINTNIGTVGYNGTSKMNYNFANSTATNGPIPKYAEILKENNTIIFHSMNIALVVFADANTAIAQFSNTTVGNIPHSNITEHTNAFGIYRMYEPTLVIPRGATLNITFINMDFGDFHNFVLSTFPPPYPMYIMQNMKTAGAMVAMTPLLNHVDNQTNDISNANATVFSYTVDLNLPPSVTNMWYMCMFPTHAMTGMWGNITLVDPSQVGA